VALLVSWSGIFVLMWAAAAGAVLGVLVAAGAAAGNQTAGLFHVDGAPGLRPWHLAEGVLSGAGGTVVAVAGKIFGSPLWAGAWVGIGLLTAVLGLAVLWRFEGRALHFRGYRLPSRGELRRIAVAAQLAGAPLSPSTAGEFLVIDSELPLARTHIEHLGLSTALLDRLADEELAALICRGLYQKDRGVSLRGSLVVACGWPVLGLDALGRRLRAVPGSGVVPVAAALVLWPAQVLVLLVSAVSERRMVFDEYDADAAVHRAGLGAALTAALQSAPHPDVVAGPLDRALGSPPPMPLRIERLGPRRPLDPFFGPVDIEFPTPARRTGRVLVVAAAVLAVAVTGVGISARAGTKSHDSVATAAASYTLSYLQAVFKPAQYHRVIEAAVPPGLAHAVERDADTSALGVASLLAAGLPSTSRATALGCRSLPRGAGAGAGAIVAVKVRWEYSVAGSAHRLVLTNVVPLKRVNGQWRPRAAPSLEPTDSTPPSDWLFNACFG
jgi:hypothetical protein